MNPYIFRLGTRGIKTYHHATSLTLHIPEIAHTRLSTMQIFLNVAMQKQQRGTMSTLPLDVVDGRWNLDQSLVALSSEPSGGWESGDEPYNFWDLSEPTGLKLNSSPWAIRSAHSDICQMSHGQFSLAPTACLYSIAFLKRFICILDNTMKAIIMTTSCLVI